MSSLRWERLCLGSLLKRPSKHAQGCKSHRNPEWTLNLYWPLIKMMEIAAMDLLKYSLRPLDLDRAFLALPVPILTALPVTAFLTVASSMALLERAQSETSIRRMALVSKAEPRLHKILGSRGETPRNSHSKESQMAH